MKKIIKGFFPLFLLPSILLVACKENNTPTDPTEQTTDTISPADTTITTTDTIRITWNGTAVSVEGSHNDVSVTAENGYVTINSSVKDITYILRGNGQGQLNIYSTNRLQLQLSNLTLICSDGPAINNQCKKSLFVVLNGTNNLTDGGTYASSTEDRKAAFFSEGQMIFSGSGSLTIKGNYKHAMASDDYIQFAKSTGTINLTAASDGMHANDGIYFDGGTFSISAGEEGVQCDTAAIVINGGAITVTAAGDKGITAYGDITVTGGIVRVTSEYKCIKTKSNLNISGGDIQVVCNGKASSGGGGPWGGGSSSSSSPEGIEAKGTITISGGYVYSQSADDAINSGGDFTITGGCVMAYSTDNDGMDANGNLYIKGGLVYAIGASDPEVALDANTEKNYTLYISGGTLIALGKLERGASITQTCYQNSSWNANTWYSITVGDETFAFLTPNKSTGGHGGGRPGGGGNGNTPLVVSGSSKPTVKTGVSVSSGTTIFNGMGVLSPNVSGGSAVTLSTYSNSGW